MHTILTVELCVEIFFASDPVLVKEDSGTLRASRYAPKLFDDNHDRRFLVNFSSFQLLFPDLSLVP